MGIIESANPKAFEHFSPTAVLGGILTPRQLGVHCHLFQCAHDQPKISSPKFAGQGTHDKLKLVILSTANWQKPQHDYDDDSAGSDGNDSD